MEAAQNLAKDPGQVAFFIGNLCQEADLIYRFAYALTLSEEAARKLVLESYQSMLGSVDRLLDSTSQQIKFELLKASWQVFQGWSQTYTPTNSDVLDLLNQFSLESRMILILVDALGVSPEETADLLELKEIEVRRYLADARKKLISFDA